MYGIVVSLDESRAPIDTQFSTVDRFCKFDDMPRCQEGASFGIFIDLFDQFLLLHDREMSSGRGRNGRVYIGVTVVEG